MRVPLPSDLIYRQRYVEELIEDCAFDIHINPSELYKMHPSTVNVHLTNRAAYLLAQHQATLIQAKSLVNCELKRKNVRKMIVSAKQVIRPPTTTHGPWSGI